jgi:hypothetical protein
MDVFIVLGIGGSWHMKAFPSSEGNTTIKNRPARRTKFIIAQYGGRMTIAQVQPLNIPTASELTKARDFLWEVDMLIADVKLLFLNGGDFALAARLKDI